MKKTFIALLVMFLTATGCSIQPQPEQRTYELQPSPLYTPTPVEPTRPSASDIVIRSRLRADKPLLINHENPLPEDYTPIELVNLYEQPRHFSLATSDILLEKHVYQAAERMFKQAEQDGVDGFILTSGYRTREKQQSIYEEATAGFAALPGASEHESGLAFDVTAYGSEGGFETTPQFDWLQRHCWDYGFILRYPEDGESITGIAYEPWHYRYVGDAEALAIRDSGLTLEEYMEVD